MRAALPWLLALSLAACKGEPLAPAAEPAGQRSDAPAAPVVANLRAALAGAGIEVKDVKRLAGHTEPSACREEWRVRLLFGGPEFLNVNRFADAAAAEACLAEYRAQIGKGGPAALDRLMPLVTVDGRYLFQFSETTLDGERREEILGAVKQGLAASER